MVNQDNFALGLKRKGGPLKAFLLLLLSSYVGPCKNGFENYGFGLRINNACITI